MSRCRSCGAEIRWARTATGRPMPLDAEPVADGNVAFTGRSVRDARGFAAPEVRVESQPPMFDNDEPRYVAHFVTCPNADEWRKP